MHVDSDYSIYHVDSSTRIHGNYSFGIDWTSPSREYTAIGYYPRAPHFGKKIKLTGFIKTENVVGGYAGLWMRFDGKDSVIAFDNMKDRGIKGTTDWKEYNIEFEYDYNTVTKIFIGGIITGKGRVWFDDFHVYVDGKDLPLIGNINLGDSLIKSFVDTTLTPLKIARLEKLGALWGFLKYHHPRIKDGEIDMDYEFLFMIHNLQHIESEAAFNDFLNDWIASLGTDFPPAQDPKIDTAGYVAGPFYGKLFDSTYFPKSINQKLKIILSEAAKSDYSYYSTISDIGNAKFLNEFPHLMSKYETPLPLRILCLFRIWNVVQYYYPYRYLIEDWDDILKEFIPEFVGAATAQAYKLTILKLICRLHDSHARIYNEAIYAEIAGENMLPFKLAFIQNHLIVIQLLDGYKGAVAVGDEIVFIRDSSVTDLISKYTPLTAGSNSPAQLRDMVYKFLVRSPFKESKLVFQRDQSCFSEIIYMIKNDKYFELISHNEGQFQTLSDGLNNGVFYLRADHVSSSLISSLQSKIDSVKNLVVDLRHVPSDQKSFNLLYYLINWIAESKRPFAITSKTDNKRPGVFLHTDTSYVGVTQAQQHYLNRITVIVNSSVQSSAEFLTMAFQSLPNCITLGETTAGTDGNISMLTLPGNYYIAFTGLGVYYPDGKQTQQIGLKIDTFVNQTANEIRKGIDAQLNNAIMK